MTPTPQPQEAVIPSEGAMRDALSKIATLLSYAGQNAVSEAVAESNRNRAWHIASDALVGVVDATSSHSTCGIAPLGDKPKPSTREAEAPVSEAVAWQARYMTIYDAYAELAKRWEQAVFDHSLEPAVGEDFYIEKSHRLLFECRPLADFEQALAPSPAPAWKPGREEIRQAVLSAIDQAEVGQDVGWLAADMIMDLSLATEGAGE